MEITKPKLKVCGMTRLEEITELIDLSIDYMGFIFYEKSPRFVLNHLNLDQIAEIPHFGKVGVFVNETIEKILEISEKTKLNLIQLHGDENEDFIIELKTKLPDYIKIIKVIRIGTDFFNLKSQLEKVSNLVSPISYLLFDTDSSAFGGTGKSFDWKILDVLDIPLPYFLSGGISLENVDEIENIGNKPFALDVNSKFETEPGVKNLEKIKNLKNYVF